MTPSEGGEERIAQLRQQITADLAALQEAWGSRVRRTHRTASTWTVRTSRLRGTPTWVVGAVAGLLAGVWSALRGRKRRP